MKTFILVRRDTMEIVSSKKFDSFDLKHVMLCYKSDVPKEIVEEVFDGLIERMDDLKNILENKKKEEFYK